MTQALCFFIIIKNLSTQHLSRSDPGNWDVRTSDLQNPIPLKLVLLVTWWIPIICVLLFLLCYFTIQQDRQEVHIWSLERRWVALSVDPIWLCSRH